MSDAAVEPVGGLSEVARVVDTFVAPSKTFEDIRRKATWWLPFLLLLILGGLYGTVIMKKVGPANMADNMIRSMPRIQQMMSDNPAQADKIHASFESRMRSQFYSFPIMLLVAGFIAGGLFLATANFMFGGTATYKRLLAVFWYSQMPLLLMNLLIIFMLLAGINVETFYVANPIATNAGYFMLNSGASPALVALISAFDLFSIWIFLLQALGVSKVARISMGKACVSVGIWWVLYILVVKVLPMAFV